MHENTIYQLTGAVLDIVRDMLQFPKSFSTLGHTRYGYGMSSPSTLKARWQLEMYSTIPDVIPLFLLEYKASRALQYSDFRKKNELQIFLWDHSKQS